LQTSWTKGKTNLAAICNDVSSTGYIPEVSDIQIRSRCIRDTAFYCHRTNHTSSAL
ncbi:hypothetical protein Tco_0376880, partial [Tanacetum coccineum]